jgi:glyoxylase-like metal-dependent hydrolase (beta-lactamase superfamily II)
MGKSKWFIIFSILFMLIACSATATPEPPTATTRPTTAPIPDAAFGPAVDHGKGYFVGEIRGGLYWVTDGIYQVMFLTTGEGVIVVDAPMTIGENLLKAISEVTDEAVTHVIYSHHHRDHIGAASMYPSDAVIISHEQTADRLARNHDPNRPIPAPTVTFKDVYTVQVGSQTLELSYQGPIHTPGNIFIHAPSQKVVMVVDTIWPGWVPFKGFGEVEDTPAFIRAHDVVSAFDFDTLIAGHVGRLGTREDVEVQQEYVRDVQANTVDALQAVGIAEIAQQTGFENAWLLFDTFLNAVAQRCADATEAKWTGRLAGADVFTLDNCLKMTFSISQFD